MAELLSKKSSNAVSTKSDVCSVKSNNGLIDLDITPSNNQLLNLCDDEDDLILTNNTKNELTPEDKSLQELIESELALRICSESSSEVDMLAPEEDHHQPSISIKKIVIEPRQDLLDINTEFIGAEINHYNTVEDPYTYRNGHTSPVIKESPSPEPNEPVELINDDLNQVFAGDIRGATIKSSGSATESLLDLENEETVQNSQTDMPTTVDSFDAAPQSVDDSAQDFDFTFGQIQPYELESEVDNGEPHHADAEDDGLDLVKFVADGYQPDERKKSARDMWMDEVDRVDQVRQITDNFPIHDNTEVTYEDLAYCIPSVFDGIAVEKEHEADDLDVKYEEDVSKHGNIVEFETELMEPGELLGKSSGILKDASVFGPLMIGERDIIMANDQFIDKERKEIVKEQNVELCENNYVDEKNDVVEEVGMVQQQLPNDIIEPSKQFNEEILCRTTAEPILLEERKEKCEIIEEDKVLAKGEDLAETDEANNPTKNDSVREQCLSSPSVAPLATPDDESSDLSNSCDSENHEEVITTSTVTSSTSKTITKTKKKKIEGSSNDVSQISTPKTKKTKKSKKSDLEKENISVNVNAEEKSMHSIHRVQPQTEELSDEDDLSNVNVKSLTQCYVSETSRNENEKSSKEVIETGVSIKQLCRSFGDISNANDVDYATPGHGKSNMETQEKAKSMDDLRVYDRARKFTRDASVFARVSVSALRASYCSLANLTRRIEQESSSRPRFLGIQKSSFNKFDALTKKNVLHVRSVDASKVHQQLNSVGQNGDANPNCRSCGKVVFQMEQTKAEGLVWHKNCFRCVQCSKQLNVDNYESNDCILYCKAHFKELFQPKPVEESDQPASDKPDLGLEELSSLNVKSRFQVFEKSDAEKNEIERSPSQVAVKRSPSILSKLAKFQAKGMDIGVADESLNGIPYEETSESEEEVDEEEETEESEIVKSKRTTRERPMSFSKMDDMKNRWEVTSQQGRKESQREARKEEIAGIRSRLFMGKQGKMKEMYQQAVATSEKVTKINPAEEIQNSTHARSIKERFERGEPIVADEDETDNKPKAEKPDEEVIAAGISRKSRSLFLELDATAAKTGRPVTPVNPKTPTEAPRRARDAFMGRQVSDDVIRSTDTTAEIQVETSDITNKFKFFETYREPEKMRKQFRITPPRDGEVKVNSPEREIYRDPDVIRADDRVDEIVHTDTARKMLSIFRQMEEKATKEDLPDGPKPLKCFTPPPEDKYARPTASDSEEEEEEEGEESGSDEERDPNYVRASDKVEDEFLKQAQNAAKAKTLRAKFEQWETTDGKTTSHHVAEMDLAQTADGEQQSIESARSLRARFESLGSQPAEAPRAAKVKVNRFVEIQTACTDVCESCEKKVYPLEKVETNNKIFHKHCFRCLQCNCVLRMDTFTLNNGKLYCIPHFKQLFIARGNYDEGFGVDPHKNKWSTTTNSSTTAPATIVANGGATPVAN
ncbi:xin actin-binding repeat-containing protein 2-like isoform X2 [Diachasmimorpha longicaudata]|uniref:xin actin-binding repeat-containing protein 2-like isoform X2 n=1 Tax=Diachasmimorpha longicaudata TaxID=58733 RepID=UPI0030B8BF9D